MHRDYAKDELGDAPTTSISILDSVASPEYVEATTAGWNLNETTPDGYTKAVTIEGNPGFETYDNEDKHGKPVAAGGQALLPPDRNHGPGSECATGLAQAH